MKIRAVFSILFLSFCIGLLYFAQEVFILFQATQTIQKVKSRETEFWMAAKKSGLPYDSRTPLQIIDETQNSNAPVHAMICPYHFYTKVLHLNWKEKPRVVFGGEPYAHAAFCAESGVYVTQERDEFGFANPPGLYTGKSDVLLVGDSTVEGACVPPGGRLADYIRKKFPKTVSMGLGANGPLSYLGTLKEFVPYLKPQYVLWFHVEGNDAWDLNQELESPLAAEYLKEDYTPWQFENWKAVAPQMASLSQQVANHYKEERVEPFLTQIANQHPTLRAFLHLHPLRTALFPPKITQADVRLDQRYRTVLLQADTLTKKYGGKLIVVVVPNWDSIASGKQDVSRDLFMQLLGATQIPYIDLYPWMKNQPDPLDFYHFRLRGHWKPAANEKVVEHLLSHF